MSITTCFTFTAYICMYVNYGLVILCNPLSTLDCVVPLDVALVVSPVLRDVAPLERLPLLLVCVLPPLELTPLLLLVVVPLLDVMPPLLDRMPLLSVGPLLGPVPLLDVVVVVVSPEVMVLVLLDVVVTLLLVCELPPDSDVDMSLPSNCFCQMPILIASRTPNTVAFTK